MGNGTRQGFSCEETRQGSSEEGMYGVQQSWRTPCWIPEMRALQAVVRDGPRVRWAQEIVFCVWSGVASLSICLAQGRSVREFVCLWRSSMFLEFRQPCV